MTQSKTFILSGSMLLICAVLFCIILLRLYPGISGVDSVNNWSTIVTNRDSALTMLIVGELTNFHIGVFKSTNNVLFLGCSVRNNFGAKSVGEVFHLYLSNGNEVSYTYLGGLYQTNVVWKLTSRGLATYNDVISLGWYAKPDTDKPVGAVEFIGSADSQTIDKKLLKW